MREFFAHFLFILAAWTLTIKYILPLGFAWAQGAPAGRYVLWDFWWAVHIALGWALLRWRPWVLWFALAASAAEIVIVTAKFAVFLQHPAWDMWRMNWFVNKVFVLGCFLGLMAYLIAHFQQLRKTR